MDALDLKLFLRAVATGSLSAAGRELGLSPAVASKHMAALEKRLGVTLLHRTTRRVSPTAQGRVMEEHAERIIAEIEGALAAVGAANDVPSGRLVVTAPATLARRHIAPAIAEFLARYPEIELEVVMSDGLLDLQAAGIDVAIRIAALEDSSMIARKIAPSPRLLCASPAYIERHGQPAHPRDLARHSCLAMSHTPVWSFTDGSEEIRVRVQGRLRTNSGDLVREAALEGLGIAIKSIWDVEDLLAERRLVRVLEDYPVRSEIAIWVLYQPRRFVPARIRAFVDFFADHFGGRIEKAVQTGRAGTPRSLA